MHILEDLVRTTIVLDADLVREALEITDARPKKEVVHVALQELVRSRRRRISLIWPGRIRLRKGFDHKAMRKLRG